MPPDPAIPEFEKHPQTGGVPPPWPVSELPGQCVPTASVAGSPPPLPPTTTRPSSSGRQLLVTLLSLCLGLFLADAVVSLVDDSLILGFGMHLLAGIRGMVFLFATLMAVLVYGLMGITPVIPKRLFLPVTLFSPLTGLMALPVLVYGYGRIQQAAWVISLCQVICGLGILYGAQGGLKLRWPLVAESQLEALRFSWRNLSVFLLLNVFVLLPAVAVYVVLCARLAVDHFSDGFVALRLAGVMVQVRTYVRHDGKTIQLVPMAHIGDPDFYRKLSQSFPTNSILLLEGVTDDRNLLTNKLSYKRAASSLGLAEQQQEFRPSRGQLVRADVDVGQFTTNTIDLLNMVTLIHARGVNAETILPLLNFSPPAHLEQQLFDDLLRKRNRHLLEEIQARLSQTEHIIVPWGAAHMPEIAQEIQRSGFRLEGTEDYVVIRFRGRGNQGQGTGPSRDQEKPR